MKYVIVFDVPESEPIAVMQTVAMIGKALRGVSGCIVDRIVPFDDFRQFVRAESGDGILRIPPMFERKTVKVDDTAHYVDPWYFCEDAE